ncbi:MAG: hypothetical protein M3O46_23465 [Myxococcota bacterium]|nr:hypothetical protein [Myxococcota bacterium]
MESQKLQLKIFVTPESAKTVQPESFIKVFHRWIKERLLPELVIDVANYAHVPEGPGVVLIGHGSDYFMDQGEGRLGLLHNRKRSGPPAQERLADLARRTLYVAVLLEREPVFAGNLHFATNELSFRINDRLAAPNNDSTFEYVRSALETMGRKIFGGPIELVRTGGPKELFSVRLTTAASPPLSTLLENAGGPPSADASLIV